MPPTITKDQGFRMTLSGIISATTVMGMLWVFAEPVIVKSVSVAMADDIYQTVEDQVEPMQNAFVVLLQRDINNVKKQIASLKFRQRQNEDWNHEDAQYLADLQIELEALEEAMEALEE